MNNILKEVMLKIKEAGFDVYVVGGYVRDYLLNISSTDYDLATEATPQDLINIWQGNIVSNNYGSVVLKYKNRKFEITTFRKDVKYEKNRFPIIKYVKSLKEDYIRRDFTINAIYMDIDNNIIDNGTGLVDLKNKTIKMIGDSYVKINEDALRILRAIRFATIYNFKLDSELSNAIKKLGYLVKDLSYDRKKDELNKIFVSKNVKYGIQLIKEHQLDKYLEININNIIVSNDLLVMWSQLDVLNVYPFKKHFKEQMIKVNSLLKEDILSPLNLYKYGLFISTRAGIIKGIKQNDINQVYSKLPIIVKKDINIKAEDICKILDIKPSDEVGKIFKDIETNILLGNINNDYDDIANYILKKYK